MISWGRSLVVDIDIVVSCAFGECLASYHLDMRMCDYGMVGDYVILRDRGILRCYVILWHYDILRHYGIVPHYVIFRDYAILPDYANLRDYVILCFEMDISNDPKDET